MEMSITDDAIAAFGEYYRAQAKALGGRFNDYGIEVKKRLVQSKTILERVVAIHHEGPALLAFMSPPKPPEGEDMNDWLASDEYVLWLARLPSPERKAAAARLGEVAAELELQTECFYWITGRARSVIRLMPGLEGFEAVGVRNVRNKLIEHPEKSDSGVTVASFGWCGPAGPVLKALRPDHQRDIFPDAGLFKNAEEFFQNVRSSSLAATQGLAPC